MKEKQEISLTPSPWPAAKQLVDLMGDQQEAVVAILREIRKIASDEITLELKTRSVHGQESQDTHCQAPHSRQFDFPDDSRFSKSWRYQYMEEQNHRHPYNVFVINGARGMGKTTTLLTAYKYVNQLGKGLAEGALQGLDAEITALFSAQLTTDSCISRGVACVLPMIVPDERDPEETTAIIMEEIFAHMETRLRSFLDDFSESDHFLADETDLQSLMQDVPAQKGWESTPTWRNDQSPQARQRKHAQRLLRFLHHQVTAGWAFAQRYGHDTLSKDSIDYNEYVQRRAEQSRISRRRTRAWRRFVNEFLYLCDCELLAIFIDDMDLAPDICETIVHTLRVYLSHPRIVTVLAVDRPTMVMHLTGQRMAQLGPALRASSPLYAFPGTRSKPAAQGFSPEVAAHMRQASEWREIVRKEVLESLDKVMPHFFQFDLGIPSGGKNLRQLLGGKLPQELAEGLRKAITKSEPVDNRVAWLLFREYFGLVFAKSSSREIVAIRELVQRNSDTLMAALTGLSAFHPLRYLKDDFPNWESFRLSGIIHLTVAPGRGLIFFDSKGEEPFTRENPVYSQILFLADSGWGNLGFDRQSISLSQQPIRVNFDGKWDTWLQDHDRPWGVAHLADRPIFPRNVLFFQDLIYLGSLRKPALNEHISNADWSLPLGKEVKTGNEKIGEALLSDLVQGVNTLVEWDWWYLETHPHRNISQSECASDLDLASTDRAPKLLFLFRWQLIMEGFGARRQGTKTWKLEIDNLQESWIAFKQKLQSGSGLGEFEVFLKKANQFAEKRVPVTKAWEVVADLALVVACLGNFSKKKTLSQRILDVSSPETSKKNPLSDRRGLLLAWALAPTLKQMPLGGRLQNEEMVCLVGAITHLLELKFVKGSDQPISEAVWKFDFPDFKKIGSVHKIVEQTRTELKEAQEWIAKISQSAEKVEKTRQNPDREIDHLLADLLGFPLDWVDEFCTEMDKDEPPPMPEAKPAEIPLGKSMPR